MWKYVICNIQGFGHIIIPFSGYRIDNDFAIYTTTPNELEINLVKVTFDANGLWGFTMNLENSPAKDA